MKEIWKDVKGYEGRYQVSDHGRVRSLDRIDNIGRKHKGIVLKSPQSRDGYLTVVLYNGKGKRITVHKLVAIAFLNHVPDGTLKVVVDHIDNNKNNNHVSNLQLISQRENVVRGNLTKGGTSEYVGVSWQKARSKWKASIRIKGEYKYLGLFNCELRAAQAYKTALSQI